MTTAPLPLSRSFHPDDAPHLRKELQLVDAITGEPSPKRWEQGLALHAVDRWLDARGHDLPPRGAPIYDIGEQPTFALALGEWTRCPVVSLTGSGGAPLGHPLAANVHSGRQLADIVTCLSILQYVADLDHCLYYLTCLLAPGGLLVLTFDYWNRCGADTAWNHQFRQRIFCPKKVLQLRATLRTFSCDLFGGYDATYHGPQVHDHSVASLVVEKRR
jgi:hypothetical protein